LENSEVRIRVTKEMTRPLPKPRSAAPLLLLIWGAAACSSDDGFAPPGGTPPPTTTSDVAYEVRRTPDGVAVDVPFVFTNSSPLPVFILGCHMGGRVDLGIGLEKRESISWRRVWTPVRVLCVTPPIRVEPGASISDTVHVALCTREACGPPAAGMEVSGIYRLVWDNLLSTANGQPDGLPLRLDESFLVSTPFQLREP
jgi:hypothetical protein